MKDTSNKYALRALKDRRAAIAGEIMKLRDMVAARVEQLAHMNAAIKILEPGFDSNKAPAKRFRRVHLFGKGELSRSVLDVLRRGGRPMSTGDVIASFMALKGYEPDARKAISHRVRANLAYQTRRRNLVTKTGGRASARWALAH
jgi:hypothetical protein